MQFALQSVYFLIIFFFPPRSQSQNSKMKTKTEKRAATKDQNHTETHEYILPYLINSKKNHCALHKMHNDHMPHWSTHGMICLSSMHSPTTQIKIDLLFFLFFSSNVQIFRNSIWLRKVLCRFNLKYRKCQFFCG